MRSVHAWFSAAAALRRGSCVHRKADGSTVNVTRMSSEKEATGLYRHDEKYVGEVIEADDGGCVSPNRRVKGISG